MKLNHHDQRACACSAEPNQSKRHSPIVYKRKLLIHNHIANYSNETQPAQRSRSQQLNYKSTIYFYSYSAHPLSSKWLESYYAVRACVLCVSLYVQHYIYKNHKLQTGHR